MWFNSSYKFQNSYYKNTITVLLIDFCFKQSWVVNPDMMLFWVYYTLIHLIQQNPSY